MCEHSSISPAAALREARRRKILENSTNRLKLIEGINSSLNNVSSESFVNSKPESNSRDVKILPRERASSEINSKLNDIINSNNELKEISDFLLQDHSKIDKGEGLVKEEDTDEGVNVNTLEEEKINFYFELLLQKRLHYVILALAVNTLLFFNVGYLFYENIFCPFYTVKAIELISRGREKEDFQPLLFLFVAGLPKSVQKCIKIFISICVALLSDLCLYLFTFIIGNKIINT